LFVFLILRFLKNKSVAFSDKKAMAVTIIMAVILVLLVCFYIFYYLHYFNQLTITPVHLFILVPIAFIIPGFLGYAMSFVIPDADKSSWHILLFLFNIFGLFFVTMNVHSMYEKHSYQKGSVYYVAVVQDMQAEASGKYYCYLTIVCESLFGKRSFTECVNTSWVRGRSDVFTYKYHPALFEEFDYKIGDSLILKTALSDTSLTELYAKKDNNNDNYIRPILEIGDNEYDYYCMTDPDQYGIDVVKKTVLDGDSVLVYKNLKLDSIFKPCDSILNNSSNFNKITDYGFIFGYKIYPKTEVEEQFPIVKEYVEQYKKRMSTNNTTTTESTAQEPD
ncbi:MAG: hypothetical protein J6V76_01840, partial [Bacteroidales bacterium]|nr:hypothetical protein [Bacteroidales bacterium]